MSTPSETSPSQDENSSPARAVTTSLAALQCYPHHYDIPLLNDSGDNFGSWKFRVQLVLKLRGLWTVVDGTYTKPDVTVDPTGSANWTRKDLEVLWQISFTMRDEPLSDLRPRCQVCQRMLGETVNSLRRHAKHQPPRGRTIPYYTIRVQTT